jgi:hypothetical protein
MINSELNVSIDNAGKNLSVSKSFEKLNLRKKEIDVVKFKS